jgi:hypothetical protein
MAAPVAVTKPTTAQAPPRMTLQSVTKGKLQQPTRTVIFGPEGVGKSTFGAGAPSPIFLGAEDGTGQLDVARFPQPESFEDALQAVGVLGREAHDFGTLVVDTVDWLEPLIWRHICARDKQENVEGYGYGKGYVVALDEWRRFLAALEGVRKAKRMHLVLIAHAWIKPFKNPAGDDFDRYEMKLHAKAGGLLKEWADAVLFANYETFAKKDEKTKRVKGISTGARLLYTQRTAAYDAKNRYSLPEELPLSWADFFAGVQAGQVAAPDELRAEILRKATQLPADIQKAVADTVAKAANDSTQLSLINNRVNARIHELAAKAEKES